MTRKPTLKETAGRMASVMWCQARRAGETFLAGAAAVGAMLLVVLAVIAIYAGPPVLVIVASALILQYVGVI